jgi:hypothetical protein
MLAVPLNASIHGPAMRLVVYAILTAKDVVGHYVLQFATSANVETQLKPLID